MGRRIPPPPRTLLPVPSSCGLMRQTCWLSLPSAIHLVPRVCYQPLLPAGSSRLYSANLSPDAWSPTPTVPSSARTCFFPDVIGLPQDTMGRLPVLFRERDFPRASCRGCRHFIMFRPLSLHCLPDRSYRCKFSHRAAETFYVRAYRASLPPHAPDMLSVRYR